MAKFLSAVAASLFAALALLSSPVLAQDAGYALRAGDVIKIEVLEDPSLSRSTLVLPNGSINFPEAGTLKAGGRTPDQLAAALASALAPSFASPPTVYVSVDRVAEPKVSSGGVAAAPAGMDVYVMGEVAAPGLKTVKPDTNLLQFLAQAGALSKFAATKRIELHRKDGSGGETVYLFDLNSVGGGPGRISGMTQLGAGDVVVVPQRKLFE
ncbi:polysaccharide biosynthesis/export family protein [Neotabrizicola sp. sgz301269]|uniref:polysaccharide biosynthesis/export family protein n=1 Tax=Neotabrizicola sp. sgz301269 TaxID=3276282 RepID=UPI00376FFAE0